MNTLRILLADDHAIMRDGLASLIDAQADMRVVGTAADGRACVEAARAISPDVVVIDISMPELNGIQATREIKHEHPHLKVLALTAYDNPVYLRQLFDAGATGYILKNHAAHELIGAIRIVAAGGTYLDPTMRNAAALVAPGERLRGEPKRGELTDREGEILRLVARGYTNKEIAASLTISVKTVETHKANLMSKLDLKNRADVVRFALDQGWMLDG